jgi:catechol 2,3-dioxygenase-like lactoylglutathione lyase family enzyme
VTRVARIGLTTADADGLAAFYCQAFGFAPAGVEHRGGQGFARMMGLADAEARVVLLRLGRQVIELVAFARPGLPYPPDITSHDVRFQHMAIVVADIEAAYARLLAYHGWSAITSPQPQCLPARSGGVGAFKFRDPEGHPLELLAFPPGRAPPYWQEAGAQDPCLGIDHSAIVVADTARSLAFYRRLGFRVAGRSLNHGVEQDRLDGVSGAVVEVTSLAPDPELPPHLELLCYRSPAICRSALPLPRSNDSAATRIVLEMEQLPETMRKMFAAQADFISDGAGDLHDGRPAALIRDPDGHALLLLGRRPGIC